MEEFNPWWFGEIDKDIEKFEKLEYKYYPKWIEEISLKPFSLNFVIGVRRVGKTLGIKLLIKKLLEKNNPYSIFYLSCETLEDYKELIEILEDYYKIKERKKIKTSYIFLDEITLLEDWWKAIRYFLDIHKFDNDVITLLGSSSILLQQHYETFSGRMGYGKKIFVNPLSFKEFYNLFYDEVFDKKVTEIFELYLENGGFLSKLNEELDEGDFISLLKADLMKIDKSSKFAKEILRQIMIKAPSALSYNSIATEIGISVNTVKDYIEIFENLFILKEILFKGLDGKIYPRKEKKFILRDPFIVRAISLWTREKIREDFIYEWVVQEHLYRKFGEVYYYKNKYEIDAIANGLKIEIKVRKKRKRYPKNVIVLNGEEIPKFLLNL